MGSRTASLEDSNHRTVLFDHGQRSAIDFESMSCARHLSELPKPLPRLHVLQISGKLLKVLELQSTSAITLFDHTYIRSRIHIPSLSSSLHWIVLAHMPAPSSLVHIVFSMRTISLLYSCNYNDVVFLHF